MGPFLLLVCFGNGLAMTLYAAYREAWVGRNMIFSLSLLAAVVGSLWWAHGSESWEQSLLVGGYGFCGK